MGSLFPINTRFIIGKYEFIITSYWVIMTGATWGCSSRIAMAYDTVERMTCKSHLQTHHPSKSWGWMCRRVHASLGPRSVGAVQEFGQTAGGMGGMQPNASWLRIGLNTMCRLSQSRFSLSLSQSKPDQKSGTFPLPAFATAGSKPAARTSRMSTTIRSYGHYGQWDTRPADG